MSINLLIITRNNFELHVFLVYFVQVFGECRNQHVFVYASLIRCQIGHNGSFTGLKNQTVVLAVTTNPFMPNGISHCYQLDQSISV